MLDLVRHIVTLADRRARAVLRLAGDQEGREQPRAVASPARPARARSRRHTRARDRRRDADDSPRWTGARCSPPPIPAWTATSPTSSINSPTKSRRHFARGSLTGGRSSGAWLQWGPEGRDPRDAGRQGARGSDPALAARARSRRDHGGGRAAPSPRGARDRGGDGRVPRHVHGARPCRAGRLPDRTRAARVELRRHEGRRDPRQPRRDDGRGAVRVPPPGRHPPSALVPPGRAPADDRARARAHESRSGRDGDELVARRGAA